MKNCIVFGANGYIGSHLTHFLNIDGWNVLATDIQESSSHKIYRKIDITNPEALNSLDLNVDYIFWFGGLTGTYDSFDNAEKFIDINEKALIHLLNSLKDKNIKPHIVFPSTRLVYKGADELLTEEAEKETKTIYAVNKIMAENTLFAYSNIFNINYTVYRICVPFGNSFSNDYSYGTLGFFINKAKVGDDITLFGDGYIKRTFSHVEDICKQIIISCTNPKAKNKILNIGGVVSTLKDVAEHVAKAYNVNIKYIPFPDNALKLESGHTAFNDAKIIDILNTYKYKNIFDCNLNK